MKLVFSGIQWCWKWTQARILIEKYNYKLIEMWQCLRELWNKDNELWRKIKDTLLKWELLSPEIVCDVIKDVLVENNQENIILDWFIRNDWNKKCVENILPDYKVVFFELSKQKAIERLLWRMYNPSTWETFPFWTKIDPNTKEELIKRKDDNEKSILKRIEEFTNKTLPTVLEQKNEWKVINVNANQSIEDVSKEMIEKLWL